MRHKILIYVVGCIVIAAINPTASAATAYKCTAKDGSVTFSDIPCSTDAKPVASWGSKPKDNPFWCNKGPADQLVVDKCLDTWRPAFRDPRSAYSEGGILVANGYTGKRSVFIDAYLRNGFGGMNNETLECDLSDGDVIDAPGTANWMTAYRALAALDVDRTPHEVRNCKD